MAKHLVYRKRITIVPDDDDPNITLLGSGYGDFIIDTNQNWDLPSNSSGSLFLRFLTLDVEFSWDIVSNRNNNMKYRISEDGITWYEKALDPGIYRLKDIDTHVRRSFLEQFPTLTASPYKFEENKASQKVEATVVNSTYRIDLFNTEGGGVASNFGILLGFETSQTNLKDGASINGSIISSNKPGNLLYGERDYRIDMSIAKTLRNSQVSRSVFTYVPNQEPNYILHYFERSVVKINLETFSEVPPTIRITFRNNKGEVINLKSPPKIVIVIEEDL